MIHCPTFLLSVAYLVLSATPLARAEQDQTPPPPVPTSVTVPAAPAPPAPAPMPPSPAPEVTPSIPPVPNIPAVRSIPGVPSIPPVPRIAPMAPPLPPPVSPGSPDEIDAPMDNALSNGILEEEGNQNPEAAIAAYQSAIVRFDRQRPTIANAIFRLGECYRKLGRVEEAKTQYARILREFPDQNQLVQLSQKHLFQKQSVRDRLQSIVARASKPELAASATGGGGTPASSVNQQKELIEQEIALVETQLANAKKKFELGVGPQEDIIPLQREILRLRRQLVSLTKPDLLSVAPPNQPDENASPTIAGDEPESRVRPAESTVENTPPQPRSRGKVYLVGPVRMPGPQEIPSDEVLTLSKAILRAGGFNDYADRKHVKITRQGSAGEADKKTFVVDVAQIYDKGKTEQDVPLEPGDLIFIPERLIRF